LITTEKLF